MNRADRDTEHRALSSLTSSEAARRAKERRTVAIVPTAAVEQHGPHLPLDTDLLIAQAVGQGFRGDPLDTTRHLLRHGLGDQEVRV